MSFPPDPPVGWQEEVEYFPSPSDIRESLAAAPVFKEPKFYDLSESKAEFWRRRHVPPGSTLVFKDPSQGEGPDVPDAAVLVLETESLQEGIWLTVKGIGASTEEEKKKVMGYFKSKKRKIHLVIGSLKNVSKTNTRASTCPNFIGIPREISLPVG